MLALKPAEQKLPSVVNTVVSVCRATSKPVALHHRLLLAHLGDELVCMNRQLSVSTRQEQFPSSQALTAMGKAMPQHLHKSLPTNLVCLLKA